MNEENKNIEELNPLTEEFSNSNNIKENLENPIEPEMPQASTIETIEDLNVDNSNNENISNENVELPKEAQEFVEVFDMEESKPSVVQEQIKDSTTKEKEQSKSGIVLVIAILAILVLAVIFMPKIVELIK